MAGGHTESPIAKFFHHWTDFPEWVDWMGEWGMSRALFLLILFSGEFFILSLLIPNLTLFTFNWLVGTSPIWLPVVLLVGFWRVWVWYIQSLYISGRNPILLEMKLPREITKSPRAMEIALTNLSINSGETTFIHRGWKGQVRPFFALEIASFGGEIHFYIWCWKNYKNVVETMMYSQYPEVELHEVEDYASKFQFDPAKHRCFGTDWRLESYMKNAHGHSMNDSFEINAYPFRTYIDYELDKDPKEEFKVEPLAQVIEHMSNILPTEQMWVQIVLRKCGKKGILGGYDEDVKWKGMVEKEVQKIREIASINPHKEDAPDSDPKKVGFPHPTWRQTEQIRSMERNLGKMPFEVGMRGIYINEGELRSPAYTGMRWMWRPYGNPQFMTHIRPRRWHNYFDYPWQDVHNIRWNSHIRRIIDAYRRRMFYHSPWIIPTNIMTNEMIASIWRPPSSTVATPGLQRMAALKAAPPSNLPM